MAMKKFLRVFVICLLCWLSLYADEPLSFATWNLRYFNNQDAKDGNGWFKRLKPVADLIQFNDLDVIGLQEMNEVDSVPMTEMLLEKLHGYAAVTCADSLCKDYNPILYKKETVHLMDIGIFWYGPDPTKAERAWDAMYRRFCTWAKFEKNGYSFFVFNIHWDHKGPQARHESAAMTVKQVKQIAGDNPVFFAGDFNCRRKYDCYYLLNDDFWNDARYNTDFLYIQDSTFNRFNEGIGTKDLDHIFVTKDIHVSRYGVLRGTYFDGEKWRNSSDHNPVIIFVHLTKK